MQGLLGEYILKMPIYRHLDLDPQRTYKLNFENTWQPISTEARLDEARYLTSRGGELKVKAVVDQHAYNTLDPKFDAIFESLKADRLIIKTRVIEQYHLSQRSNLDHLLRFGMLPPAIFEDQVGLNTLRICKTYAYRADSLYDQVYSTTTPSYALHYGPNMIKYVLTKL